MRTLKEASRSHGRQVILFLLVGALTTALYLGIFAFVVNYLGANYAIGVSVAYPLAVGFHFLMNHYLTFQLRHEGLAAGLRRYVWLVAINYVLSLAVVDLCVRWLELPPTTGALAGIAVTFAISFILAKYWVFRDRTPAPSEAPNSVPKSRK